ncbi:unnamed protein product [Prunus brigantina]
MFLFQYFYMKLLLWKLDPWIINWQKCGVAEEYNCARDVDGCVGRSLTVKLKLHFLIVSISEKLASMPQMDMLGFNTRDDHKDLS